jgi:hypothetical protein
MPNTLKRLDQKLDRIHRGVASKNDFIIADAKDADMAFGITAPGQVETNGVRRWKSLAEYRDQIREIIQQDLVDIMLLSASNVEQLAIREHLFESSSITPAARANDTTDIWVVRGGKYASLPSRSFHTASIEHIKYGRLQTNCTQPSTGADLGLYSITFTNNIDSDYKSLEDFTAFRHDAVRKGFRYFLEVFNPNVDPGIPPEQIGAFLNDHVVRALAGVTSVGRPLFLKIPYNGPGPLEELVGYDSSLIVGILGGSAGTTRDAFQLLSDVQKHGARVILFGRKINLSEHPLTFIKYLRLIADGSIEPEEAVKAYHDSLAQLGLKSQRTLEEDQKTTSNHLNYRS